MVRDYVSEVWVLGIRYRKYENGMWWAFEPQVGDEPLRWSHRVSDAWHLSALDRIATVQSFRMTG